MAKLSSGGGSGSSAPKTDAQKKSTAAKGASSAALRLRSVKEPQSQTLLSYGKGAQTYEQQEKASKANPLERIGSTIFAQLNRPSQAVLRGIQAADTGEGVGGVLRGIGRGVTGSKDGFRLMPEDETNLRGALNTSDFQRVGLDRAAAEEEAEKQGGRVAGLFDVVGTTILDPTTYTGIGGLARTGGLARSGIKAIEKELGKDVAAEVAAKGTARIAKENPEQFARIEQALRASEGASRLGADELAEKMLGGKGNALTRNRGALEQAQGLRFGTKTVLTKDTKDKALGTVTSPLGKAASQLPGANKVSAFSDKIANALQVRHGIKRELGEDVADAGGLIEAGAGGKAALKKTDIMNKFGELERALIKADINPDTFSREVVTPALEAGRHLEVADQLRAAGRDIEADYIRAADELRRSVTDENVAAGLLSEKNLHNVDTYVPFQPTPEFETWLRDNPQQAAELFSYKPNTEGILRNAEVYRRRLGPTISRANEQVRQLTGGAVPEAFDTNAVSAIGRKAAQTLENVRKTDIVKGYENIVDETGNPVAVRVVDNTSQIKKIDRAQKQAIKALDAEINQVKRKVAGEKATTLAHHRSLRDLDKSIASATQFAEKLSALSRKMGGRAIASGVEKRTARAAVDVPAAHGMLSMINKLSDVKSFRDDVFQNSASSSAERAAAQSLVTAARKALAAERAAAKTGTRKAGERIGSANATAKFSKLLLDLAERDQRAAMREVERLTAKRQKMAATAPASSAEKLAMLQQERRDLLQSAKTQKAQLRDEATKLPNGYVTVDAGPLGKFYARPAIAKRWSEIEGKSRQPGAWKFLGDISEAGTQSIKNLLLNAPPFFIARSNRDLFGNMIQMWSKGFKNPKHFAEAAKVQKQIASNIKDGDTYEQAIARLPQKYRELEELIYRDGVTNSGQIRSDVSHIDLGIGKSKSQQRVGRLSPTNAENYLTHWGSLYNTVLDDFSRRAMYYDQIAQHGDSKLAAQVTKEALFDYADLAEGEKALRKFIPFYTFMARNLQLQKWALQNVPQKSLAIDRLRDSMADEEVSGKKYLPQYALRAGQIPLFGVDGVPVLGTIQTPQQAAEQTVQPLVDIASFGLSPKYRTQENVRGGLAGLTANIGGLPGSIAKTTAEGATGVDLFTGAPLQGTRQERIANALLSAVPRGSQIKGTSKAVTAGTEAERLAAALSLLGVSGTAVTPKRETSELYRRKRAIEDEANLQDIPTATELKKQGKMKKGK